MNDTPDILARIVAGTRARLAATPVDLDALEAAAHAAPAPPDALVALRAPGVRVIAEVKRQSPSEGAIRAAPDPTAIAAAYAANGAAAISVLTEPDHFGGSLDDLARVAAQLPTPCLRKDFIVGRRQLLEARGAGASLVLLIASVLDDAELVSLREAAEALGMNALVEAHTQHEVARAATTGARIIGVNNRDLTTFVTDLATSERLRAHIPDTAIPVSESGIAAPSDVVRLWRAGYRAFLVGTSLMRSTDPGDALARLVAADIMRGDDVDAPA